MSYEPMKMGDLIITAGTNPGGVGLKLSLLDAKSLIAEHKALVADLERLQAQNADLLAALHIVKEQRQRWWGKAVERSAEIQRLTTSAKAWELQAKGYGKVIDLLDGDELRQLEQLTAVIDDVAQVLDGTRELNMSNFDIDDVAQLNSSHCEIYQIIHKAAEEVRG